jgi:hypothetical protein
MTRHSFADFKTGVLNFSLGERGLRRQKIFKFSRSTRQDLLEICVKYSKSITGIERILSITGKKKK